MKRKFVPFFTLAIIILCAQSGFSQQSPQYSLYMLNPVHFNPGAAGMNGTLSLTGVFRKQWVDLSGSPSQQNFTVDMPLFYMSSGVGLNINNDVLGARRYTSVSGVYNFNRPVGRTGTISIGVSGSLMQFSLDGSRLRTPGGEYSDDVFNHNDDVLPLGEQTATAANFGAGLYYQDEKVSIGLSGSNITEPVAESGEGSFSLRRHYFLYGRYNVDLSRSFSLQPSVMVKSDLAETQLDLSLILTYNGSIFGGCSVRGYNKNTFEGLVIMAGWKFSEQATLAYAYDLSLFPLGEVQNGSHEIIIQYVLDKEIGKGKLPKIIYNPRFL